ncbi:hypothetical protein ES707_12528 [subsurface metagenome]
MNTLLQKMVKCRKVHRCIWCGEEIEAGETAFFWKYVLDDGVQNEYYHTDCYAAMVEWDDEKDDGFYPYTFERGTGRIRPK